MRCSFVKNKNYHFINKDFIRDELIAFQIESITLYIHFLTA